MPLIKFNGVILDRAGVMAALTERAERIAGESDRLRFDCELPYLADIVGQSAEELHQQTLTALDSEPDVANLLVPNLLNALDALIRDVVRVESSQSC